MVDIPWLVAHATYDENLYICGTLDGNHDVQFRFAPSDPAVRSTPRGSDGRGHYTSYADVRSLIDGGVFFLNPNQRYNLVVLVLANPKRQLLAGRKW